MEYKIEAGPEFSQAVLNLSAGESIVAESGAMAAMSAGFEIAASARGGAMAALKRKAFGGESIFQTTYTASETGRELILAPPMMGDIVSHKLESGDLFLQSRAFLAAEPSITLDTKWQGMKGFFSGEGLFLLKVSGDGTVFFSSYGAIIPIDVDGSYIVDTGYIVGFESSLDYRVRSVGGLKSLFLSGEGLVCEFSGSGRVWAQSRKIPRLAEFLHPFRRVQKKQSNS